jgi:uncharacterized membrane protein YkoI
MGFMGVAAGSLITHSAASADTASTSSTATTTTADTQVAADTTQTPPDPSKGGHTANGITETVLTGDTAEKVKAAALAAYPGGTIQRVETDAEGAAYEAHMTKADGTPITVKFDASYNVTGTESGMGAGGPGGRGQTQATTQSQVLTN